LNIGGGTWEVQPALTPPSKNIPKIRMNNESTNNQRLNAFNRGNIVSHEQSIKGTNKLPKPPISNGVIIKGVIKMPWKLMQELY
jgi:hypothetical protein